MQNSTDFTLDPQGNVADVLLAYPAVIPAFLSRRMACVGCDLARFETLSSASQVYSVNLEEFLADLERYIHSKT
ncbi:MAG TPA: DUF1858 domain-containing protein [Anaerolineaceae bacterium]